MAGLYGAIGEVTQWCADHCADERSTAVTFAPVQHGRTRQPSITRPLGDHGDFDRHGSEELGLFRSVYRRRPVRACADRQYQERERLADRRRADSQILVQVWHTPAMSGSRSVEPIPPDLLQEVSGTFGMLSATARLQIVWLLAAGERDVGTLAAEVGQPVATVSHHLAKLKLAGLVRVRKEGRRQVYLIADEHVAETVQRTVGHYAQLHAAPRRGRVRSRGA